MARPARSSKDHKKKRTDTLNKIRNKLKIRKLGVTNKRGKLISTKKKGLSNIPAAEHDAKVNRKARGFSNLGKNYKKQEAEAFKKAEEYKKSKPTKKDTKTKTKKKSRPKTSTPAGKVRYKGKLLSTKTAQGRNAMNRLKAKKRAQEMAKKRK